MDIAPLPGKSYVMEVPPRYCVYAHTHEETIFYIGQGRLGRPFERYLRSPIWRKYIRSLDHYTIHILGYFDTSEAAKAEEDKLLTILQPCCNIAYPRHGKRPLSPLRFLPDAIPYRPDDDVPVASQQQQANDTAQLALLERQVADMQKIVATHCASQAARIATLEHELRQQEPTLALRVRDLHIAKLEQQKWELQQQLAYCDAVRKNRDARCQVLTQALASVSRHRCTLMSWVKCLLSKICG
jgi:hypothetical protein